MAITTMKARRYGGAERAWDVKVLWPMEWMMVGRNTGIDEYAMLEKKNIIAVKYAFGSEIV